MNLIIDIGNTRTKIAFFDKNIFIEKANIGSLTLDALSEIIDGRAIEGVIMSVSGQNTEGVQEWLKEHYYFIYLNHETPIPIKNQYETPHTLGKDRLASAVAAHYFFPNDNCLTIDGGTALTFNYLDKDLGFMGGNITAGLGMRFKALHHFTAKLPLVERNTEGVSQGEMIGSNTNDALLKGVQLGILSEIEGFVERFSVKKSNIKILLTGGDSLFFKENLQLKNTFYEPNLVFIGLNQILNYNLQKQHN